MLHHFVVEDKLVGEASNDKVEQVNANKSEDTQGDDLTGHVVSWPCRRDVSGLNERSSEELIR